LTAKAEESKKAKDLSDFVEIKDPFERKRTKVAEG